MARRANMIDDMAAYMKERRHQTRQELLERLGGKCAECSTDKSLVFDHVDPDSKEINPCFLGDYGDERREEEVEKLQILCATCHSRKTHEDNEELYSAPRVCACGEYFENHYAYAGHRTWCDE